MGWKQVVWGENRKLRKGRLVEHRDSTVKRLSGSPERTYHCKGCGAYGAHFIQLVTIPRLGVGGGGRRFEIVVFDWECAHCGYYPKIELFEQVK